MKLGARDYSPSIRVALNVPAGLGGNGEFEEIGGNLGKLEEI